MAEHQHIQLNPTERTLYRLFLAHPKGIRADDLVLHWDELCAIYAEESIYDDPELRADKMESLCAESKKVFYANISRIKRKFRASLGARQAQKLIIKRDKNGVYRISGLQRASAGALDTIPYGL